MYNCNLHSSYLNLDILDQAEHTVSRRSLFPINKMERVFGEWPHWIGKLVFSGFWWFPRSSIISQCSGHFLVSHSLPVAFSFSPKLGKFFFVFWYKLKDAFGFIYPLNTSCHLRITQGFLKVFEQSNSRRFFLPFPPFCWRTAGGTSWFSGMFCRDWWIFPSKYRSAALLITVLQLHTGSSAGNTP